MYKILIQKFGGTSVEDARAMERVIEIIRTSGITRRTRPLVVLSACAGVTNALIRTSELSLKDDMHDALISIDQLEARHARIARDLLKRAAALERVLADLHSIWEELRTLVRGVNLLGELTPRSRDQFQSVGERASTLIVHAALSEKLKSVPVRMYDAREFFLTNGEFTAARPIALEIRRRMKKIGRELSDGAIGITQGFIGSTIKNEVTTIGRGGSDFSAAIQGVAVDASEIQIWTDVAGILTCDPRIAPAARTIERISFSDASELAFFGAKVLHPETIWPAVEKGIPVRVLSSKEPDREGTIILDSVDSDAPITGIAIKRNVIIARITSRSALPDARVLQAVSDALAEQNAVPLAVSLSVDSAVYVLDNPEVISRLRSMVGLIAKIEVEADRALITLVGPGLKSHSGIAARIFRALGRTNCEMISYGGSETAASFVVEEAVANRIVKRLHREFFH
ncbi:MAG TPA: aspartate kinase [Candidatus Kapabacteria bacterium]|jgi:aspartate kinase|nr:aspartate kinase [Candidatus Kapabacteria bacterium]